MTAYDDGRVSVHLGDCLDVLRTLPDASVDAVVTDPPYLLGFMGREWDTKAGHEHLDWHRAWCDEVYRVLKPGGHMLAFGGTRTWHRLACAVEDAGFEVRDSIAWLYGSGFPKSLDVSKAIDKAAGATREVVGFKPRPDGTSRNYEDWAVASGSGATIARAGGDWRPSPDTAPATPDAERWQGWGTALKPAFEPVVVARKPLQGTVAANVLAHGTGALNVDGCRIEHASEADRAESVNENRHADFGTEAGGNAVYGDFSMVPPRNYDGGKGRWPANVVLDESQAAALDEQSGESASPAESRTYTRSSMAGIWSPASDQSTPGAITNGSIFEAGRDASVIGYGDTGGASRFFYVAKAPKRERPTYYRPTCECEDSWPTPTPSPARATDATTEPGSSSTSRSGSGTTGEPSPRATRSTTSTATNSTTTPTTSSPSLRPITSASTPAANSETVTGGSPVGSAASSSLSGLPTGTSAAKGGRSTDGAARATSHEWSATSVCGECGAPSRREAHATVKPLDLMRWLVRLVTPPGGVVLEPFAGSGTTVEACIVEGFRCIAIEREADYLPLILQRIHRRRDPVAAIRQTGDDLGLFELDGEPA